MTAKHDVTIYIRSVSGNVCFIGDIMGGGGAYNSLSISILVDCRGSSYCRNSTVGQYDSATVRQCEIYESTTV